MNGTPQASSSLTHTSFIRASSPLARAPLSYGNVSAQQLTALLAQSRAVELTAAALTGCVSALSSCRHIDHAACAAALKQYGALCAAAQCHLAPADTELHDCGAAVPAEAPAAIEPMAALPFGARRVSDEEIEGCGYLGWLSHRWWR